MSNSSLTALEEYNLANEVVVVRDGAEELDYLSNCGKFAERASGNPAVMLLDLKLPKVDGLEVLRQVKSDAKPEIDSRRGADMFDDEKDMVASYKLGVNGRP